MTSVEDQVGMVLWLNQVSGLTVKFSYGFINDGTLN